MLTGDDLRFTFDIKLKTKPRAGDLIVIGPEATAGSLHEAGHSLFRVLRGDVLVSVWYRAEPHIDRQLMKPVAGAGATKWQIRDHDCDCGGFVRPLPGNQFLDEEEQRNGFNAGLVSLRPQCPRCMHYAVTYLAAIYAGGAATECYMPKYHDPSDNYFDDRDTERWFENLPWLVPHKTQLIDRARILASEIVRREQKALMALCMLVAFNEGPVDGKDAERTIRDNLVSTSLADYPTIQ